MTASERDRANRQYYLNGGRCPNCGGKRSIINGQQRCEVCAEKERKRKKEAHDKRVAEGLCVRCGGPRDDKYMTCKACRDKDAGYKRNGKKLYNQRKMTGICVDCGVSTAEAGRVLCKKCMNKRKVHNRINDPGWAKKAERRKRLIEAGLCIDCSKPTDREGKQRCSACLAARRDSTKKYQITQRIKREAEQARRRRTYSWLYRI